METLLELCRELENTSASERQQNYARPKSIINPSTRKVRGYKTRSTSSKVNHTSVPPRTKMIDTYQVDVLHRSRRGTDKRPKRHRCPLCRLEGHHARTCHNILLLENAQRADKFLRELIDSQRIDSYISSLAKRQRHSFIQDVLDRIKRLSVNGNQSDIHP